MKCDKCNGRGFTCKGVWSCDWDGTTCDENSNCGEFEKMLCPKCEGKKELNIIKQLTLDQLREQFENTCKNDFKHVVKEGNHKIFDYNKVYDFYYYRDVRISWDSFKQCAKANGILKE